MEKETKKEIEDLKQTCSVQQSQIEMLEESVNMILKSLKKNGLSLFLEQ